MSRGKALRLATVSAKVQERKEPQEKRRVFKPSGPNATVVTAAKIRDIPARGPGQFAIRGHNYSI